MEDLGHKTDADVDVIGCRFKSRRLLQVIVATMIGLAISAAINLIDGDWTNLDVHVPAQLALLCALWALRKARFELANTVLLVTGTVAVSVLVWQNSGLRDPAMIAYPAILAFASTMGGRRLFLSLLAMILLVVALVGVAKLARQCSTHAHSGKHAQREHRALADRVPPLADGRRPTGRACNGDG